MFTQILAIQKLYITKGHVPYILPRVTVHVTVYFKGDIV